MAFDVRNLDRTQLLGHEAREPLVQLHPDLADTLREQADRGREHEVRPIGFEQVDRADVDAHPGLKLPDACGEGFGWVGVPSGQVHTSRDKPRGFGHTRTARQERIVKTGLRRQPLPHESRRAVARESAQAASGR